MTKREQRKIDQAVNRLTRAVATATGGPCVVTALHEQPRIPGDHLCGGTFNLTVRLWCSRAPEPAVQGGLFDGDRG